MLGTILMAGGLYVLLFGALMRGWRKAWRNAPAPDASSELPISVLVAAHNEAANLPELLQALFSQTHPSYEVWIVLDRCTDESATILRDWQQTETRLKVLELTSVPEDWSPKKWAIQQGVQAARHELLALTDADCRMGPHWLTHIAQHFDPATEVVLGISPYPATPTWLNRLIQYETYYAAFQYIGWAGLDHPYMGVGRNLAYRKSWFEQHGGLETVAGQLSGDDDLLINAFARGEHTRCMLSPESFTYSAPKNSWQGWFRQKMRHLSASNGYSGISKLGLGVFHLTHLWFYLGILLSLFLGFDKEILIWAYLIRTGLCWLSLFRFHQAWKMPGLLSWFPVLDFLFFLYNLTLVPIGLIKTPAWTKR